MESRILTAPKIRGEVEQQQIVGKFMFLICLKEAGLGTSVSQVYSNPTREVGMILELLKGVMTGLQLPKVENDDNREGLIKASMLARKTRIKNVSHYINDSNYEFQPLLQLAL